MVGNASPRYHSHQLKIPVLNMLPVFQLLVSDISLTLLPKTLQVTTWNLSPYKLAFMVQEFSVYGTGGESY